MGSFIKNFNDIRDVTINYEKLARLKHHILDIDYIEKNSSYFAKMLSENKKEVEVNAKKVKVSNSKEEKKKILWN